MRPGDDGPPTYREDNDGPGEPYREELPDDGKPGHPFRHAAFELERYLVIAEAAGDADEDEALCELSSGVAGIADALADLDRDDLLAVARTVIAMLRAAGARKDAR